MPIKTLHSHSFHGNHALIWAQQLSRLLRSVCDNDSRLCVCCPQTAFHLGGRDDGWRDEKGHREAEGQRGCRESGHRRISQGERKSRRLEEWRGQGERGSIESWAKPARTQDTGGHRTPAGWQCGLQLVSLPKRQWRPLLFRVKLGSWTTTQCLGGPDSLEFSHI